MNFKFKKNVEKFENNGESKIPQAFKLQQFSVGGGV